MLPIRRISTRVAILGFLLAGLAPSAARAADLAAAQWIWSPKYEPGHAPDSSVYFRKSFTAPAAVSAKIEIACDNAYVLFVNGRRVGSGDAWQQADEHDLKPLLKAGKNTIAVKGTNADVGWAGLVAELTITGQDKRKFVVATDATWRTTVAPSRGWEQPGFDDTKWSPARSFGPYGSTAPWGNGGQAGPQRFTPTAGFRIEPVLGNEAGSLVAMTFTEAGDLLVSREGGPLYLVRNLAGGTETATAAVWCDKVHNCQGILSYRGHVYAVGDGPNGTAFYRLTDTTGRGKADKLELMFQFDGGMGDHGPHAPIVGPDGLIYLLIGNHAHYRGPLAPSSPHHDWYEGDLVQPKYEDANGHARGKKSPGGTVVRMDPDCKRVEMFCGGFRNAYDMAFNRQGELFTFDADMEWDVGLPWYRPIRVNHCIPGAEFGWRSGWSKWPDYYLDSLGSVFDVGRGSPTGVVFYNATAYPPEYRDAFFMCDWSRGRILVSHLEPDGASYKGKFETFLEGQPFNVTDAEVGPDGLLYFSTGGRGTRGGVYRAVWEGVKGTRGAGRGAREIGNAVAAVNPAKPEQGIWRAVRQPQLRSAWAKADVAKIHRQMGDQWGPQLVALAANATAASDDRVQALELMQLFGPAPEPALLVKLTADADLAVRSKAVYLLGLHHDAAGVARLVALLDDPQPVVRRLACEALVRAGQPAPKEKAIALLADPDRYVSWSARRLLERLPVDSWRRDVLKAESTRSFLVGSVALMLLKSDRPTDEAILARSRKLLDGPLADNDRLDVLRVVQLALIRSSLEGDQVPELRSRLAKMYPAADWRLNRELVRLLVYLQDPAFTPRLIAALDGKQPLLEKLHAAMYARFLQVGWTPALRDRLLKFYESTRSMQGGNSFHGYFANATSDFIRTISTAEQFRRIVAGAKTPGVTLQLVRNLPDKLPPEQLAALRRLDRELVGDRRDEGKQLATAVLLKLGQAADQPTLAYLHATFESAPERRQDVAAAICIFTHHGRFALADRDLLVRSLSVVDGSTARDVLRALVRFAPVAAKPGLLRQVILIGLKLKEQGADDASALLVHWTNQRPNPQNAAGIPSIAGWQKWFVDSYPNEPEPKLPIASSQDKYTYAQIMAYLASEQGRKASAVRGAAVFERAVCIKCHRFGNRGEGVGPDLTNVSRRFQRKEILESVLYPSLVISDQFASKTIVTQDGRTFTGIVGPTASGVSVMQADLKRVEIAKKDIAQTIPSKISAMPERLFNPLTLDDIADLFAYLGKPPAEDPQR